MIKKYICFFKKDSEVKTLTFGINQNLLTNTWGSTIETALEKGHNTILGLQNSFDSKDTIDTIIKSIDVVVKILEKYNATFVNSWPPTSDISTALNDLHHKFQLTQESNVSSLYISEEYDYNLHLLNKKIHEAENLLTDNRKKAVWFINRSLDDSVEITDELRKYWGVKFVKYNPARSLYLGYHTIGKDLYTCFRNNDVEVVKTNGVRQQQYISTEAIFHIKPRTFINRDSALKRWLTQNDLNSFVDWADPIYKYNQQAPVLGKLKDNLSDTQIIEIWKDWEFFKVDAE